jgi:hypothetical protein
MKIIVFLVVAAVAVIVSWIVLAFVIFVSRALMNLGKPPEWHAQHASAGVSVLHMIGSVVLGIWLAYRLVLH